MSLEQAPANEENDIKELLNLSSEKFEQKIKGFDLEQLNSLKN
jgi:hypothetical protein